MDFGAGTTDCAIRDAAGGELALPATYDESFDAPPVGWSEWPWAFQANVTYSGGEASLSAVRIDPDPIPPGAYTAPLALEFRARFGRGHRCPTHAKNGVSM